MRFYQIRNPEGLPGIKNNGNWPPGDRGDGQPAGNLCAKAIPQQISGLQAGQKADEVSPVNSRLFVQPLIPFNFCPGQQDPDGKMWFPYP